MTWGRKYGDQTKSKTIFIHHGTQEELYNDCHYDTKAIVSS
jgi:hypothetical protein